MKSCLFCHIHTLQYCGNCLLLGQSLLGIVLRGKAQLGVEQALFFKITDEIQCGKRERPFQSEADGSAAQSTANIPEGSDTYRIL